MKKNKEHVQCWKCSKLDYGDDAQLIKTLNHTIKMGEFNDMKFYLSKVVLKKHL